MITGAGGLACKSFGVRRGAKAPPIKDYCVLVTGFVIVPNPGIEAPLIAV